MIARESIPKPPPPPFTTATLYLSLLFELSITSPTFKNELSRMFAKIV